MISKPESTPSGRPDSDSADLADSPAPVRAYQPRFSLRWIMLMMLILSILAAAGRHLVRSFSGVGSLSRVHFVLFTVAAPVLAVVVVSLVVQLMKWLRRWL